MRYALLITLLCLVCFSCTNPSKNDPNALVYHAENADGLAREITLTGDKSKNILTAQIKLSPSNDTEVLSVNIQTNEGLHSDPLSFTSIALKSGADTTISLKFEPFNNRKLYQVSGMHGNLKSNYTLLVSYRDGDKIATQTIKCSADKNEYAAYLKQHGQTVTGYSFDTGEGFNEKEKQYLKSQSIAQKTDFVYLSDQEIAIAGLNFRLTDHYYHDTLYADFSVVNHADFQVKIIADSLDINIPGAPTGKKSTSIEKVSGTQQYPDMIEKGDRAIIHFKKAIKMSDPANQKLQFVVSRAFLLKGNKQLFGVEISLLPHQFN